MTLRPPGKIPPKRTRCLLVYSPVPGLVERHSIGFHDGARWYDVHNGGSGIQARLEGWCLVGRFAYSDGEAEAENDQLRQALRDIARAHAAGDRVSVTMALDIAGIERTGANRCRSLRIHREEGMIRW